MTNEELEEIKASIERSKKWWNSLSDEERQCQSGTADTTRLWEDWTDCDPVAHPKPRDARE